MPEEFSTNFIETASTEDQERYIIATQLGALNKTHYGPYVAHSRKCPASRNLVEQEKNFYFQSQPSFINKVRSIRSNVEKRKHTRKSVVVDNSYLQTAESSDAPVLSTEVIGDENVMAEMLYNTSKLYYMWAKKENISHKVMARYWHGEHENFIYERRIAITKGWEDGIKKARKMMQSQKFKMFMNKRIIKRFANQIKDRLLGR